MGATQQTLDTFDLRTNSVKLMYYASEARQRKNILARYIRGISE